MRSWKLTGTLAAVVLAGAVGMTLPGMAADKNAKAKPDSSLAYVDLAKVTDEIKKTQSWQSMVQDFEKQKTQYRTEIEGLSKTRYLTAQERTDLENLTAKKNPTDSEKQKIADLQGKSDKLEGEFQQLAQTEKLTADQSKRIQELTTIRETGLKGLQDETDKRAQQLQTMEAKVLDEMQTKVLDVVKQVAQNKDVTLVLDRQAVLYGGTDLTQEVLGKLPK